MTSVRASADLRVSPSILRSAYRRMRRAHGHQAWWPGESAFEVCVGAILTQNTSWKHVERAIESLKKSQVLDPRAIHALPEAQLAELLRPAGCFLVKARRLRAFVSVLIEDHDGCLERLFGGESATVRARLLAIKGIGPETADCMLLYAGAHPSFVVDAYTRRIFSRHGWCPPDATYDALQRLCEGSLRTVSGSALVDYWQDYHAQIVAVGKDYCRPQEPRCDRCPLRTLLPGGGPAHASGSPDGPGNAQHATCVQEAAPCR